MPLPDIVQCISSVDQLAPMRGKGISIALAIHSVDPRRCNFMP